MEAHEAAVAAVSTRVRQFHARRQPFRNYHGSTNSTWRSRRRPDDTVDTTALARVLSVDREARVAVVEPNVPMDALVEATWARHGLLPPVVMEFPGITAGGGFSGTSGESSSFRYGAFDSTVRAIEIVLPDGEVAHASRTERPDLFWGAASAFGTLGVITLLEVELIEARKYVRISYSLAGSFAEAMGRLEAETRDPANDFVDAIVFSPTSTLVCTGRFVDAAPSEKSIRRFSSRGDPWFYVRAKQVERQLRKHAGSSGESSSSSTLEDHVPLTDYLFRYDRGGFWAARYAFRYFATPFNRCTRYLLDPLMHTRALYRAMHHSGLMDSYMVQDVGIPYDRAAEFYAWLCADLAIHPLWLCPLRVRRDAPDSAHGLHARFADPGGTPEFLMNFGIWGPLPSSSSFSSPEAVRHQNRALERKVHELGGTKWLYAQAFYTEDEFWAHYDRPAYDALRERYGAAYLPSVYDKVKVDIDAGEGAAARRRGPLRARVRSSLGEIWPLRGVYGVYKTLVGSDHLLKGRDKDEEKEIKKRSKEELQKQQKLSGTNSQSDTDQTVIPTAHQR